MQKIYKNIQRKNKATKCGVKKKHISVYTYHVSLLFAKIISDSYLHSAVSLHELSVEVRTG